MAGSISSRRTSSSSPSPHRRLSPPATTSIPGRRISHSRHSSSIALPPLPPPPPPPQADVPDSKAKFIPVAERELKAKELEPFLALAPDCCTGFRSTLWKAYVGPTVMGHTMHLLEHVFFLFLLGSILMVAVADAYIPTYIYGSCVTFVGTFALILFCGVARYGELAEEATKLETTAAKFKGQLKAQEKLNDGWDEEFQKAQGNLETFCESVGMVAESAGQIGELADALGEIINAQKAMQAEERALFELEKEYQKVTRSSANELEIENCKRAVTRYFRRHENVLDTETKVAIFKKDMQANRFLMSVDEKGKRVYGWEQMLETALDDGIVTVFEFLRLLDMELHGWFMTIRTAMNLTDALEEELIALDIDVPEAQGEVEYEFIYKVQVEYKRRKMQGDDESSSTYVSSQEMPDEGAEMSSTVEIVFDSLNPEPDSLLEELNAHKKMLDDEFEAHVASPEDRLLENPGPREPRYM